MFFNFINNINYFFLNNYKKKTKKQKNNKFIYSKIKIFYKLINKI
ncbi:hypothetical protein [Candidatus Carsonella ruddii]|uniref:Uncharacterized protein n=1 Tax=Carsonella ruddii TaxID=114186 RepID=A0A1U9RRZ4_CARRU|nr:hypothetical protein [Candidatus Carsonella ruddii]AQU89453.1 hypothetical protein BW244_0035 [Candidatus Carsonella ruddii]